MNKLQFLFLFICLILGAGVIRTGWIKDIGKKIEKGGKKVIDTGKGAIEKGKEAAQKAKEATIDPVKEFATQQIYEKLKTEKDAYEKKLEDAYSKIKYLDSQADNYVNIGMTVARSALTEDKSVPKPVYCNDNPMSEPPFITSSEAQKDDKEDLISMINKYSPVAYLADGEIYSPMQFSQYCCGRGTSLLKQGTNAVVMPKGTITPEKIYNLYKKITDEAAAKGSKPDFPNYFGIAACTKFGENPAKNKDAQGNLTTPAYVLAYEQDNNIFLQFIFFYGYNGTFTGPILGYKPLPAPDVILDNLQGLHESDIEHISMLIDKTSKKLISIYYGAHGDGDGNWINADNPDIKYENGHPVVYIAKWSHGCYPKAGTWVRVLNLANDVTTKGQRWTPKFIRIYPDSDTRFNPKTMGWIYVPGKMGAQGIDPLGFKSWFANVGGKIFVDKAGKTLSTKDGEITGRKYSSNFAFCKNPPSSKNPIDAVINTPEFVEYAKCLASKIKDAPLPPSKNRAVPPAIPAQLKPMKIVTQ